MKGERRESRDHCIVPRKDYGAAYQYLNKAAVLGNVDAYCHLSLIYLEEKGVEQDVAISLSLMEKSCSRWTPTARYQLGYYETKNGTFERVVKQVGYHRETRT